MIPGGNDSFGTGLSAGGAQVMGQSAGLNDLVKLGMARQKQHAQPKPWNVPLENVDTGKIKEVDAPEIINLQQQGRDAWIKGNYSTSIEDRYKYQLLSDSFMAQAQSKSRSSQNEQINVQQAMDRLGDPNIDPERRPMLRQAIDEYRKLPAGTPESEAAFSKIDFSRNQKWNQNDLDKTVNSMAQTQTSQGHWNTLPGLPHERQQTTYTSRTADRGATIGEIQRQVEGNETAKSLYTKRGQDIIDNSGNAQYVQNLANQYHIDPKNPIQVAYAQHADQAYNNMGKYSVTSNKLDKDPSHLSITVGNQGQPAALPYNNAPEYIKAKQPDGGKGLVAPISYEANTSGIPDFSNIPNTKAYLPNKNGWATVNGINEARTVGGIGTMSFYKPNAEANGIEAGTGKAVKRQMNEGAVSQQTLDYIKEHPNSAVAQSVVEKKVYHVQGKDNKGKPIEAMVPLESLGQAGFKTTGKGLGAAVGKQVAQTLRDNFNTPTKNSHVVISNGKKTIPGF